MGIIKNFIQKREEYNSWQNRYDRLKNTESNKKARKSFEKMLAKTVTEQPLSEEWEAILFSQAFELTLQKNPSATKFPEFDEYDVTKTETTYIVKGFCDSTNSYGAQVRGNYELEVYKCNGEWTCITDVGAKYLKWFIIGGIVIFLPTIIAYCSIPTY